MRITIIIALSVLLFLLQGSRTQAQQKRIYLAADDHTDYLWSATEEGYRQAFLTMLDYYINQAEATSSEAPEFQSRWNCDGSLWLRVYRQNRSSSQFSNLITKIRSGHITAPLNPLVLLFGCQNAEMVIRGMMYAGSLQREFNLDFPMAVSMENQGLPYGIASLWAGAGARYSWKGVCGCATSYPGFANRPREIYYMTGPDNSKILMKWYSMDGANTSLGGYAEARDPLDALNKATAKCNTTAYPFAVAGAFGKGWDDVQTLTNEFVTVAKNNSTTSRKVFVSNMIDFFQDFENTYSSSTPSLACSYGNDWDLNIASLQEVSARMKRSTEKLRTAEALASVAVLYDPSFGNDLKAIREEAWLSAGLYWEHNWENPRVVTMSERANWERTVQNRFTSYVDTLYNRSAVRFSALLPSVQGQQIVWVFNPLSWERTEPAEIVYTGSLPAKVTELESGNEVPSESFSRDGKTWIRFLAARVPSAGYKLFRVQQGTPAVFSNNPTLNAQTLENEYVRVTVTRQGVIKSLYDKKLQREMIAAVSNKYANDLGSGTGESGTISSSFQGNVSASITVTSSSPLPHTTTVTIYRGIPRVDVVNQITQNFSDIRTWAFSFNLSSPEIHHEEVGAIMKARLVSQGGQYSDSHALYNWFTLNHFASISQSTGFGVTLSNADAFFFKAGNSSGTTLDVNTPQITVLAGGQVNGTEYGIPSQGGESLFTYRFSLIPFAQYSALASMKQSLNHQNPLAAGYVTGSGSLPGTSRSFLAVSDTNVVLWALKPADDGPEKGLIARFWNLDGTSHTPAISFFQPVTSAFSATHIETDLQSLSFSGTSFSNTFNQWQMKTFRVTLQAPTAPVNHPPAINNQTFSVAENSPSGTLIGKITASDPDAGQTLSWSILSGNTSGAFTLQQDGSLRVNNASMMDFETWPLFTLRVLVRDNGSPSLTDTATVTVTLLNVNEPPVAAKQTFALAENPSANALAGTITAADPDAGQTLSFSILSGNTGNAFSLNPTSGQLRVNNPQAIDYETIQQFRLQVQVSDNGSPPLSVTTQVTVNITNVNEAPVVQSLTYWFPAGIPDGYYAGNISATDPDGTNGFTYQILSGNSQGYFALDAATGVITIVNSLALQQSGDTIFPLSVRVTDNGTPPLSGDATITLRLNTSVVFNPPVISYQEFSVPENSAENTFIGKLTATDNVSGRTLIFHIEQGNLMNAVSLDSLNGTLAIANPSIFNYEKRQELLLLVRVCPQAACYVNSDTAWVRIRIINANDAPVVHDTLFVIPENLPLNAVAGILPVYDEDAGQNHTFAFVSGDLSGGFGIHSNGSVYVTHPEALNFERRNMFSGTVQITDNGTPPLSATATLNIVLTDVNDPPVILPLPVQVAWEGNLFAPFWPEPYVTDEDNSFEELTLKVSGGTYITASLTGDMIQLQPGNLQWQGTDSVLVTVTDPGNLSASAWLRGKVVVTGSDHIDGDMPSISVYPNPSHGNVTFLVTGISGEQSLHLRLMNQTGKVVMEKVLYSAGGTGSYPLNMTGLAPGLYLSEILFGGRLVRIKIVII